MLRVPVFEAHHGSCSYLPNRTWVTYNFQSEDVDEQDYEQLLANGWRRSGSIYYQNHCPGCRLCIPIRVSATRFAPTKSQRRVGRRNEDVSITVAHAGPHEQRADDETYQLYARYTTEWHGKTTTPGQDEFEEFLVDSPLESIVMQYRVAGHLVGAGWLDVLPGGLSSVYFAFDPDYRSRSLGTFSLMREVDQARLLGKPWLYLGFYVPGSRTMAYKANFHPHQLLVRGAWEDESGAEQVRPSSALGPDPQ